MCRVEFDRVGDVQASGGLASGVVAWRWTDMRSIVRIPLRPGGARRPAEKVGVVRPQNTPHHGSPSFILNPCTRSRYVPSGVRDGARRRPPRAARRAPALSIALGPSALAAAALCRPYQPNCTRSTGYIMYRAVTQVSCTYTEHGHGNTVCEGDERGDAPPRQVRESSWSMTEHVWQRSE